MGSIVRPLSHSLSFEAIDVKYLLNQFAITRLSSITFPSIIKEGFRETNRRSELNILFDNSNQFIYQYSNQ